MVALFAYWVNIGSVLGSVVDNKTKERLDKLSYRIPLACLYIVPVLLFIALFFVPESPRWLLHRGKEQEARKALEQLRGSSYATLLAPSSESISGDEKADSRLTPIVPTLLEIEWAEMVKGVEEEKREQGTVSAFDMFRGIPLNFGPFISPGIRLTNPRSRPPSNHPLLLHDRLPNCLRRVVSYRLPNIFLHGLRNNKSLRILHNEHLLRISRRQRRHVRYQ